MYTESNAIWMSAFGLLAANYPFKSKNISGGVCWFSYDTNLRYDLKHMYVYNPPVNITT